MIRLIHRVFLLTLILSASLVAIIGLTYRNTNRFAYLFSNPDGTHCETPCLFGADPQKMVLAEISTLLPRSVSLRQMEKTYDAEKDTFTLTFENEQMTVFVSETRHKATVGALFKSDLPTLGEMLVLIGNRNLVFQLGSPTVLMAPRGGCDAVVVSGREQAAMLIPIRQTDHCDLNHFVSKFILIPYTAPNLTTRVP